MPWWPASWRWCSRQTDPMELGFIGLGAMGLPMTRHLLAAGHRVTVASRGRGPIDVAVAEGAVDGGSPAGVAAASDVVVLCVPDSPDVVQVVGDLLPAIRPGAIVVDCSTIDPDVERAQHVRVAGAGGRYLEAPVSGGTAGAIKGTLTLMVGGDASVLDEARPALEPFAGRIVHIGAPGLGQVVKLCNNLLFAAQMVATAEATALALASDVDVAKLHEVLVVSTGDCVGGADAPARGRRGRRQPGVERVAAGVRISVDGEGPRSGDDRRRPGRGCDDGDGVGPRAGRRGRRRRVRAGGLLVVGQGRVRVGRVGGAAGRAMTTPFSAFGRDVRGGRADERPVGEPRPTTRPPGRPATPSSSTASKEQPDDHRRGPHRPRRSPAYDRKTCRDHRHM